ncbi:MAG: hypothetical protein HY355_05420 [Armatimonadetes bacterium]|nr:hypothetical protein [Armatimonadota bacterium]
MNSADLFPIRLVRTGVFLVGAILGFPVVAAFVVASAPGLALLQHRSMLGLAANHLVTLGWGTMVALGALHQLLPSAAGVRREPGRLVLGEFVAYVTGVVLLALGFLVRSAALRIAGGTVITATIAVFLWVAAAILRPRTRTLVTLRFVATALACLGLVVAWGLLLVLNWQFVFWRALLLPMGLEVHLALGLIGWFALLVTGVSYYLLPRFADVRDLTGFRAEAVFAGLAGGTAALIIGTFGSPLLISAGLLLVAAAGVVYAVDLGRFIAAWNTPAWDLTRAHWRVLAIETVLLSTGLALAALGLLPGEGLRWLLAGVTLFLLGWVTLAITGQAYKVTPFLMWYYRFSLGMPALEVPRLEAPYWPRAGVAPLVLLTSGGPLIGLGTLLAAPAVSLAGGIAFLAGACCFSYLLGYSWLRRLWGGRRPAAPDEPR